VRLKNRRCSRGLIGISEEPVEMDLGYEMSDLPGGDMPVRKFMGMNRIYLYKVSFGGFEYSASCGERCRIFKNRLLRFAVLCRQY